MSVRERERERIMRVMRIMKHDLNIRSPHQLLVAGLIIKWMSVAGQANEEPDVCPEHCTVAM